MRQSVICPIERQLSELHAIVQNGIAIVTGVLTTTLVHS